MSSSALSHVNFLSLALLALLSLTPFDLEQGSELRFDRLELGFDVKPVHAQFAASNRYQFHLTI